MTSVEEKKKTSWSQVAFGLLFFFFGGAALITGRSSFDLGDVEGLSVRIGGGLLSIVGFVLVILAFRKR